MLAKNRSKFMLEATTTTAFFLNWIFSATLPVVGLVQFYAGFCDGKVEAFIVDKKFVLLTESKRKRLPTSDFCPLYRPLKTTALPCHLRDIFGICYKNYKAFFIL